jgi:hypothetical protein
MYEINSSSSIYLPAVVSSLPKNHILLTYSATDISSFLVNASAILELTVCALLAEVKLPSITFHVSFDDLHAVTWAEHLWSWWTKEPEYLLIHGLPCLQIRVGTICFFFVVRILKNPDGRCWWQCVTSEVAL